MKKKIFIITSILAASLSFQSCQMEFIDGVRVKDGGISFNVSLDGEAVTKAAMSSSELLSEANVKIYMGDFSGLIRSYKYSSIPSTVYLPADSYRVDVEAGEIAKSSPSAASWEQKSYKGSAPFEVKSGVTGTVQVLATVCNAITRVSFDHSVSSNFMPGYCLTIGTSSTDESQQLVYDAYTSGDDGYFILSDDDASFYWSFSGVANGKEISKSGIVRSIEAGKVYIMNLMYTETDGSIDFSLNVDDSIEDIDDVIIFEPVSTGLTSIPPYDIWAGHVIMHADVDESEYGDPSAISFAYSGDGTDWTTVPAVRDAEGQYSARAEGLTPSSEYSYKLVIGGEDMGSPRTFTTDDAPQMPNSGFEYTSNDESKNWISFYDPSAPESDARMKWWDNGSSASAGMLGSKFAICYSDSDVPAGIGSTKSAMLTSISAAGKLAAGNLFSGEFAGLDGLNGKVNFGRPWHSRPSAVTFWYKYKGGRVDKAGGPSDAPLTTSDYDRFQVKVAVGNWDYKKYGGSKASPVQVNTSKPATFWDYDEIEGTIAYGQLTVEGDGSTGGWTKVTIPLDYKTETEYPATIVFSAAASIYGDYFVGSSSSVLWLDEIELIYE